MKKMLFQALAAASLIFAFSCQDKEKDSADTDNRHQFSEAAALSVSGDDYDVVFLELTDGANKTLIITCITSLTGANSLRSGTYYASADLVEMAFIAGARDDDGDYGTFLFEDDGAGGGYTRYFTAGSFNVANGSNGATSITIDLIDSTGEKLSAEYNGALDIVEDSGYDLLDGDIAMTDIVYAECQYYGVVSGLGLWALLLSTSAVDGAACTDILLMFFTPDSGFSFLPLNTYPMASDKGGNFYANTALYGFPVGSSPFGCWYLVTDDGRNYNFAVPSAPSKGWVKTEKYGADGHRASFEFYDYAGHKITGSYSGKIAVYDMTTDSAPSAIGSASRRSAASISPRHLYIDRLPFAGY